MIRIVVILNVLLLLISCNEGNKMESMSSDSTPSSHSKPTSDTSGLMQTKPDVNISVDFQGNRRQCDCCSLVVVGNNGKEISKYKVASYLLTLQKKNSKDKYKAAVRGSKYCDSEFNYFSDHAEVGDTIRVENLIIRNWKKDGGKLGGDYYFIIK